MTIMSPVTPTLRQSTRPRSIGPWTSSLVSNHYQPTSLSLDTLLPPYINDDECHLVIGQKSNNNDVKADKIYFSKGVVFILHKY